MTISTYSQAMKKPPIWTILRPFGGVLRRFQSYLSKTKLFNSFRHSGVIDIVRE
jgi:hypothetical protein